MSLSLADPVGRDCLVKQARRAGPAGRGGCRDDDAGRVAALNQAGQLGVVMCAYLRYVRVEHAAAGAAEESHTARGGQLASRPGIIVEQMADSVGRPVAQRLSALVRRGVEVQKVGAG